MRDRHHEQPPLRGHHHEHPRPRRRALQERHHARVVVPRRHLNELHPRPPRRRHQHRPIPPARRRKQRRVIHPHKRDRAARPLCRDQQELVCSRPGVGDVCGAEAPPVVPLPLLERAPGPRAPGRGQEHLGGQAVHRRERAGRQGRGLARELAEAVRDGRRGGNQRRRWDDAKARIERIGGRRRAADHGRRGNVASDVKNDSAGRGRRDHQATVAELSSVRTVGLSGKAQIWGTKGASAVHIRHHWHRDQFGLPSSALL
ncbi:hypothetical protein K466DRAFT_322217 [Polyporus arcularius HHB13444]|uniref:Uncharacterized protein n=1 Tax=Polyporus arcularius HHB13444 TaxID=1314778 RepID=A0A5C3PZ31_9APHY|nr:hypothetical protein K466DRAFT_322217 [Polyporus arcularius HHB13444]